MGYKRWRGNTGRPVRIPGPEDNRPPEGAPRPVPPPPPAPPPPGTGLEGLLSRLDPGRLEREDWLVLGILWLLYRLSGDTELLIAMGIYMFG